MTQHVDVAEQIARAVLYEGHILYPYRRSALKNRQPWSFGTLAPETWAAGKSDPCSFQAECLCANALESQIRVRVRFLHLSEIPSEGFGVSYGESIERNICLELTVRELLGNPLKRTFTFPEAASSDGRCNWRELTADVCVRAEQLATVLKISLSLTNTTALNPSSSRDEALLNSLVAAHASFDLASGEFISLLDPAPENADAASACRNIGLYPVLIGDPERRNQLLASPIILYDFPQIAPESSGDFFDATEIDEMLALRVLTLTEEEKAELRAGSQQAQAILERTEALPPEHLLKVHGVIRGLRKLEGPQS